jgi:hypothetical protein
MKDNQFEKELEKMEDDQWSIFEPSYLKVDTINLPTFVGSYEIGKDTGTWFSLLKKPNWFHRTMVRLILGWVWKDK